MPNRINKRLSTKEKYAIRKKQMGKKERTSMNRDYEMDEPNQKYRNKKFQRKRIKNPNDKNLKMRDRLLNV